MNLRPYQRESIEAVERYLADSNGNPLVVSATGTGKTVVFATMLSEWLEQWPQTRMLILAHQKELLTQAAEKIHAVNTRLNLGFYCTGISQKKDATQQITLASIQTIYKRATDLDPFDIVIVDEAHLIPTQGFGRYRRFLDEAKLVNPRVRVIGFTATPFRLAGGHIVDSQSKDHIFDFIAYETKIRDMIDRGYLCPLTSKATATKIDPIGIRTRRGDYIESELAEVADTEQLVEAAVSELNGRTPDRHSILAFCCGVDHALHVRDALRRRGVEAETITGETSRHDRERILKRFKDPNRRTRMALTNMNVLTTGLDVTRIDCIALLRPTKSTSLYVQMVGRGFRLDELKGNTLVLDFAGNVSYHGPVDLIEITSRRKKKSNQSAPTKTCPECDEIVSAAARECAGCGYEFEFEESPKHGTTPNGEEILSINGSRTWHNPRVSIDRHRKPGKPDSLRVTYRHGVGSVTEWVCVGHGGFAGQKAKQWWRRRLAEDPPTVDEALADMFLPSRIAAVTASVTFRKNGRYTEITSHDIQTQSKEAHAQLVS